MKTVLITGGLGFIGSHVNTLLNNQGISTVLMDNLSAQIHGPIPSTAMPHSPLTSVIRGDVRSRRDWTLALENVNCVIHLAAETGTAQSMYEPELYTATNVSGTALLLDILANQRHSVKTVVLASSRSVYGEGAYDCVHCGCVYPEPRNECNLRQHKWDVLCPRCGLRVEPVPTPECAITQPASVYAATKLAQEHLIRSACKALGVEAVIFRFQNVYGEGQSLKNPYTGILSIFSNRIRQGKVIRLYEDGEESRDFVHVDDVARAVVASIGNSSAAGKVLNVGSGIATSVASVATALLSALGSRSEPVISGEYRAGDIRCCYADLTEIQRCLKYHPSISFERGMERFAEWVLTQPIEDDLLDRATQQLLDRQLMVA